MKSKYIILVGDGMGDYPLDELAGKTPLEAARTPNMDRLLPLGRLGLVRTIPDGMEPGSDVANMSLLGYDPARYHTGRAPLEAASMGIRLAPEDVALRCNLVTVERDGNGVEIMADYSAGHIGTEEARSIVASLQEAVSGGPLHLHPGVSYRHLLVWSGGRTDLETTPPHDISGKPVGSYEKCYDEAPVLRSFRERAASILAGHPVNMARKAAARHPANAVWLWGQGRAPSMPTLKERFGITGAMISAVDLLKGLGVYAGLEPINVPGATGYLDTNYAGKVAAALGALDSGDLVYVHIEAPDEAGHEGSLEKKIEAIEAFDERVVGPVVEGAARFSRVRLLLAMDHFTPVLERTHVTDPAPFLLVEDLYGKPLPRPVVPAAFSEREALTAGLNLDSGVHLFNLLLGISS